MHAGQFSEFTNSYMLATLLDCKDNILNVPLMFLLLFLKLLNTMS